MATFTVLAQQNRQGTFTSSAVTIPASPPQRVTGTVLIDLVDMEDTATDITMSLWVSADGGGTWSSIGGCGWRGGPQDQKNNVTPSWSCTVDDLPAHAGKQARGEFSVQPRKRVGLSLTV